MNLIVLFWFSGSKSLATKVGTAECEQHRVNCTQEFKNFKNEEYLFR